MVVENSSVWIKVKLLGIGYTKVLCLRKNTGNKTVPITPKGSKTLSHPTYTDIQYT